MKELKIQRSAFAESKSYPVLMQSFIDGLDDRITPVEKRKLLEIWKEGFNAAQEGMPDWFEGMPPFKDVEYAIHPLMGHQVVSRHRFEPPGLTQEQRLAEKKHTGFKQPKLTPFELDPAYHDPQEPHHEIGDIMRIKQYPISLEVEEDYPKPDFSHIKTQRLREAVEVLEFKIGFDHKSNRHVLYSPLAYNKRWDMVSRAVWMRALGIPPKAIANTLDTSYNTVKTWMRLLKGQPLIGATGVDWGTGFNVHGEFRYFSPTSTVDAPKHKYVKHG